MKKISNDLIDRSYCEIKKENNKIIIKIGPNTTLTSLRNAIKENARNIEKFQEIIRKDIGIKKTKRDREGLFLNTVRDEEIYRLSKLSKEHLISLIKDRDARMGVNYKDMLIADIMNQTSHYRAFYFLGKETKRKDISFENVRKIIERQKRLNKGKKNSL